MNTIAHARGSLELAWIAGSVLLLSACTKESPAPGPTLHEQASVSDEARTIGGPFISNVGNRDLKFLVIDDFCTQQGVLYANVGQGPITYNSCVSAVGTFDVKDASTGGNMITFRIGRRYIIETYGPSGFLDRMYIVFHGNYPGYTQFDPCASGAPNWVARHPATAGGCPWISVPVSPLPTSFESYQCSGLAGC